MLLKTWSDNKQPGGFQGQAEVMIFKTRRPYAIRYQNQSSIQLLVSFSQQRIHWSASYQPEVYALQAGNMKDDGLNAEYSRLRPTKEFVNGKR